MTKLRLASLVALSAFAFSMTSCVPLAVGAAAGYVAHDNGYRVQSPVKKTDDGDSYED
jgi:hypothetical protein